MKLKTFIQISSSAFLTPLPLIRFTNEEIADCTIEATKGAKKSIFLFFFILCFNVSVTLLINTLESSIDFMILIISFTSSF